MKNKRMTAKNKQLLKKLLKDYLRELGCGVWTSVKSSKTDLIIAVVFLTLFAVMMIASVKY